MESRNPTNAWHTSDEGFRRLIEQVKDHAIFQIDLQGRPTTWNEGVRRILGFTEREFVGCEVTPLIFTPEDVHANVPQKELDYATRHGSASDDRWLCRKDRSRFFASGFTTALHDSTGKLIGFFKVIRDLTDMKRTEQALRESEERLRLILESATDYAIITTNTAGKILTWNFGAQQIFGYSAEEAVGHHARVLYTPEDRASQCDEIERETVLREGRAVTECWQQRKDGSRFWASGVTHRIPDHQTGAILKILRDWTEQKLSKEKLEHTVEDRTARLRETVGELESFSYSVAHDMRAPLRAMQGFAIMLQEELGNGLSPPAQDYLRRITNSANRLDLLVQDVLNYSRVARSDLPRVPISLAQIIAEVIESSPNLQPPKADINIDGEIPMICGNHAALTQVVANILSNGVKFVSPGVHPRIRIRVEDVPEIEDGKPSVKVWFEDNGIGISAEAQQRMFQMFQRLNPASRYEGTGIGLAIVRKAVERMGGSVGVESEPGKGSRFSIQLHRAVTT